jgi:hypothetical protein|tara:strand:- start:5130 stop:5633 length:504 start_codon:yes stop_codon:yes gene_type:complete
MAEMMKSIIKKDVAAIMNPMIAQVSLFLPDSLLPPGKLPMTISYPAKIIITMAIPAANPKTNLIVCAMKAGMHWPALIKPSVKSHPTLLRLESMSEGVLAALAMGASREEKRLFIDTMLPQQRFSQSLSGFTKPYFVILCFDGVFVGILSPADDLPCSYGRSDRCIL